MIHVILSVVHVASDLSEEDKRMVSRSGICYHILTVRNGRTLISATLPEEILLDQFVSYFDAKGRQCKIIGEFYPQGHCPGQNYSVDIDGNEMVTGAPNRSFDITELLERLPDKDDLGGRYTEAFQFVKPLGWKNWRL